MLALLKVLPLAAGFGLAPLVEPAPVEYAAATRLRGAGAYAAPYGAPIVVAAPSASADDGSATLLAAAGGVAVVAALAVGGRRAARPARVPRVPRTSPPVMETIKDLEVLAKDLNPVVGFYDPLKLSEGEFWGDSNEATIGWIRQAEIKHGRIAMAGFVGFIVHSNGIHFPYKMPGDEFVGGSAVDLWYNLPYAAKAQIIAFVGIMEWWGELRLDGATEKHYMRGGKPGYFPPFDDLPHPVPFNLFDPFGFQKGKSDEWKAKRLNIELNNGRLAMLGLMSFLSEGAIPGSVPALKGLIPQNSYDVMSLDFALHGFK